MEQSDNLKSLTPAELRLLIRSEDPRIRNTTGLANGKNCVCACVCICLGGGQLGNFCIVLFCV